MSGENTDLVIEISMGTSASDGLDALRSDEQPLVDELRRYLQPGAEVALVFKGCMATTSILWLSGPSEDHSLRAAVRLLGVSVLPTRHGDPMDSLPESKSRMPALQLDPLPLSQPRSLK